MQEYINLYGGIASIIGFFIFLGTFVYKQFKKYRKIKKESEQQLIECLKIYKEASITIGSRTDLGFFLQ